MALQDLSRQKPCPKNRVEAAVEAGVLRLAFEQPALGQQRVSNELRKEGLLVSPGEVRGVWVRHDLETYKKRLKALEARMAQEQLILTEEQLQALEKSKQDKEAHGEIETQHPGYRGAQDTYYVGTLKKIGRIYQQAFIDTYTKVAQAKVDDRKNALVAARPSFCQMLWMGAERILPDQAAFFRSPSTNIAPAMTWSRRR
ncbi:MAG: hypothetical protein FJY95_09345 [Candidatus Handelsmanbacteria bacterium]|nr:hypothetical protein [Candidatus Handelsmanbacteria bacterium]